jgi:hypothetical protein
LLGEKDVFNGSVGIEFDNAGGTRSAMSAIVEKLTASDAKQLS